VDERSENAGCYRRPQHDVGMRTDVQAAVQGRGMLKLLRARGPQDHRHRRGGRPGDAPALKKWSRWVAVIHAHAAHDRTGNADVLRSLVTGGLLSRSGHPGPDARPGTLEQIIETDGANCWTSAAGGGGG
jgi:stage III sporulation protein SpoIIIAA